MKTDKNFSLSVFTFIFNSDCSKILLIKRNEEKRKKWGFDWGIIGGRIEPGEYSYEGAIREAKEEIGIDIPMNELKFLHFEERPNTILHSAVHFFYAWITNENIDIAINQESDEYCWFKINEMPDSMIEKPEQVKKIILTLKKQ